MSGALHRVIVTAADGSEYVVGEAGLTLHLAEKARAGAIRSQPGVRARIVAFARPPRPQVSLDEIREMLLRRARGETYEAIAAALERSPSGVMRAIRGWCDGTSALARAAKAAGTWSPKIEAPL